MSRVVRTHLMLTLWASDVKVLQYRAAPVPPPSWTCARCSTRSLNAEAAAARFVWAKEGALVAEATIRTVAKGRRWTSWRST